MRIGGGIVGGCFVRVKIPNEIARPFFEIARVRLRLNHVPPSS